MLRQVTHCLGEPHRHQRRINRLSSMLLAVLIGCLLGCDESSKSSLDNKNDDDLDTSIDQTINDRGVSELDTELDQEIVQCESLRRPIIFVHGFLAAGDTWSRQVYRLIQTGSCPEWIRAYDWNSLDMSKDHTLGLDLLVDELLELSGRDQVDLVGHSAGGGVSYDYLSSSDNEAKVAHYVHIGSFPNERPAGVNGETPTLNLWSSADTVVEGEDIPDAVNVSLEALDHYAIATSFESYSRISSFLYNDSPLSEDPYLNEDNDDVYLHGRSASLGENKVNAAARVQIWSLDRRGIRETLISETETDADGRFVFSGLSVGSPYEIVPTLDGQSTPSVRYFTPPLLRNNDLFYLRTFPEDSSLAGLLTRQLPTSDDQVSIVIFNAHRAFLSGVDSLTLNGDELLTTESASADNTTIALFVFDINADGESGGNLPLFDGFPFLAAVDKPIMPSEERSIELDFNGKRVNLPSVSADKGPLVVVFP